MNRRQLSFSTAKAALVAAFSGSWLTGKAKAQAGGSAPSVSAKGVIRGVPGSPSATVSHNTPSFQWLSTLTDAKTVQASRQDDRVMCG